MTARDPITGRFIKSVGSSATAKAAPQPLPLNILRKQRVRAAAKADVNIQWFIREVSDKVTMTLYQRMKIATEFVKTRTVKNISIPVEYRRGTVIRSLPGEFPRAETTQLMKTIFTDVKRRKKDVVDGYIGTPLHYGLDLEVVLERQFLSRTLSEEIPTIRRILGGPIGKSSISAKDIRSGIRGRGR